MHIQILRQPEKLRAWLTPSRVHRSSQREKKPAQGGTASGPKPNL